MKKIYSFSILLLAIISCSNSSNTLTHNINKPLLTNIVTNTEKFYPNFNSETYHYAATCDSDENFSLKVSSDNNNDIYVNNKIAFSDNLIYIKDLTLEKDIEIKVSNPNQTTYYFIHCIDDEFIDINVNKSSDQYIDDGFFIISPRYNTENGIISYLIIADSNGVPRFRKKINTAATDFKIHKLNDITLYSYLERTGKNSYGHWDNKIILLNENFQPIRELETIGLNHTDNHDFLVSEDFTFILLSYNSIYRDLTPYGLTSNELTRDSIVQEIDLEGNILLEWNSWDAVDKNNCKQHRWPDDYAHINAVSISSDNNLVLSLRGCSQILKINRKTGETIWKLNGPDANFEITGDPYNEFCGQHTASEIGRYLYIFDNGGHCLGDREDLVGLFSRALVYELKYETNEAEFLTDYSMNKTYVEYTPSGGSFFLTPNNNWLINWAVRTGEMNTIDEVTPSGEIISGIRLSKDGNPVRTYRAYKVNNILLPINTNEYLKYIKFYNQ